MKAEGKRWDEDYHLWNQMLKTPINKIKPRVSKLDTIDKGEKKTTDKIWVMATRIHKFIKQNS